MKLLITIVFLFVVACNSKSDAKATSEPVPSDTSTKTPDDKLVNDTIITSERIDGPANIRDTVNGKIIFSLNDKIAVAATEPQNKWLQVGVIADLSQKQMDSLFIAKGSKIIVDGKEVGQAVENIHLNGAFKSNEGLKGELIGYTFSSNIKSNTIPENVFSIIVNSASSTLTINDFKQFLKDFQFNEYDGLLTHFKAFEIDENWIDDPSPLLRLWLLFQGDKFYGVFHSRPLALNGAKTMKVKRGFYFSTFSQVDKTNEELINAFNSFIVQVD